MTDLPPRDQVPVSSDTGQTAADSIKPGNQAESGVSGASGLSPSGLPQGTQETSPSQPAAVPQVYRAGKKSPLSLVKKLLPFLFGILLVSGGVFVVLRFILPKTRQTGKTTLTYWGLWESENTLAAVLDGWKKDHPDIEINYIYHSPKEYRQRLQSALAEDKGPDLFRFHNSWVPMLKDELASVPASLMDAAAFKQTFYPVAADSLRSGANYLGIPLEIDTLALFYNQDIFTAAGVTPPKTWDELRQTAARLTVRDDEDRIQRSGIALGTTSNIWHWPDILALMMLQNGVDLTKPVGTLAEDALSFYSLFTRVDHVWDDTLPVSVLAFATEKTAMFFGFSWDVFEIKNLNPDLNFKIVPVPQLPGTDITWASFWVEGVAKRSKKQAAAWEFLKYLSSEETMEKLYQAQSKVNPEVRVFGEPYSRVAMADRLKDNPLTAQFIIQAPKAKSWYLCSRTFDNGINDRMIKYFEDAVNAVNEGQSPQSALVPASEGVAQILADYGLLGRSVF